MIFDHNLWSLVAHLFLLQIQILLIISWPQYGCGWCCLRWSFGFPLSSSAKSTISTAFLEPICFSCQWYWFRGSCRWIQSTFDSQSRWFAFLESYFIFFVSFAFLNPPLYLFCSNQKLIVWSLHEIHITTTIIITTFCHSLSSLSRQSMILLFPPSSFPSSSLLLLLCEKQFPIFKLNTSLRFLHEVVGVWMLQQDLITKLLPLSKCCILCDQLGAVVSLWQGIVIATMDSNA